MEWQTYLIGSQIHTLFSHKQSLRHRNPYLLQSLVLQIFRFHCVSPKNNHPMNKQQYIWTNTRRDKSFKWDWDVIWKCWRDSHIIRGHYLYCCGRIQIQSFNGTPIPKTLGYIASSTHKIKTACRPTSSAVKKYFCWVNTGPLSFTFWSWTITVVFLERNKTAVI